MAIRSRRATLGVVGAVAGMGALCCGFKAPALVLFAAGLSLIEHDWRTRHPMFQGRVGERWQSALDFYRRTHLHPTNRTLHVIGIPLIAFGAIGLFVASPSAVSPVWLTSLGGFAVGWALNIVGHAGYEKRAPAFSEDALSFLAGPVWDLQQLFTRKSSAAPRES